MAASAATAYDQAQDGGGSESSDLELDDAPKKVQFFITTVGEVVSKRYPYMDGWRVASVRVLGYLIVEGERCILLSA